MNDQSSQKDFNKASHSEDTNPQIDYSHEEIMERLALMGKLSKNGLEAGEVKKLKDQYKGKIAENNDNRWKQNVWYNLGKGQSLHMEGSRYDLEDNRKKQDQHERNKTMLRMKEFYTKHQSIKNDLDKAKDKNKGKEQDQDFIKE